MHPNADGEALSLAKQASLVSVKVSESIWLLPTWTLPTLRLLAVAVSDPGVTSDPESGTVNVGFDACWRWKDCCRRLIHLSLARRLR